MNNCLNFMSIMDFFRTKNFYTSTFTIFIKGSPKYFMEMVIASVLITLHILLILDLNRMHTNLGILNNKKQTYRDYFDSSNESVSGGGISKSRRNQVETIFSRYKKKSTKLTKLNPDRLDAVLAITPSGFVRREKQEKGMKQRIASLLKVLDSKDSKYKETVQKCVNIMQEHTRLSCADSGPQANFCDEPIKSVTSTYQRNILEPVLHDMIEKIVLSDTEVPPRFRSVIYKKLLEKEHELRFLEKLNKNKRASTSWNCKTTFKLSCDQNPMETTDCEESSMSNVHTIGRQINNHSLILEPFD